MPEALIGIVLVDQRVHGLPVYGAGLKGQTAFLVGGAPTRGSWRTSYELDTA